MTVMTQVMIPIEITLECKLIAVLRCQMCFSWEDVNKQMLKIRL